MTLSRRRFLTISAAFAGAPSTARAHVWQGHAFGAEISVSLTGPRTVTGPAIGQARQMISHIEGLFSLYKSHSALSRLNETGHLTGLDPHFIALIRAVGDAHSMTDGLFDPTIQSLWQALATGQDPIPAIATIGWERIHITADTITLAPGQTLTFNGIAQGYATDMVCNLLHDLGMSQVLVNIGEHRALGGPFRLGLHDPQHGHLGNKTIRDAAIATSSPATMLLTDGHHHILHASRRPIWSTVSVDAPTATVADALSTALIFADRKQIADIKTAAGLQRITLVDENGDLFTL